MMDSHHNEGPVLSSIKKTCERLDIGKTMVFRLISEGKLDTIKIGAKTLVTETSIQRFVSREAAAA